MMMFWSKVFKIKNHFIVAICDKELLGKRIKFNGLTIAVNKFFYGGDLTDEEKAVKLMDRATIGNLLGKRIVELALEKKFIAKENIMLIGGIPHAQFI